MKIKTSAKLNLNLAIKSSGFSSFHRIESLIVPIGLYDEINIDRNSKDNDSIIFKNNLELTNHSTIHKALFCLRNNTDLDNFFNIRINKKIPIEAGLGGGSSDAAAVSSFCILSHKLKTALVDKPNVGIMIKKKMSCAIL